MSYNPNISRPVSTSQPLLHSNYSQKTRLSLSFPEHSPFTKQEFADECDINVLMARYQSTGAIPNLNEAHPQYLDVSKIDFQTSMDFVAGANTLFHELPSAIRNRFDNSPAEFLDFCSHEKNRPELAEMGLLKPRAEWTIPIPPVVPPAANLPSSVPIPPPTIPPPIGTNEIS